MSSQEGSPAELFHRVRVGVTRRQNVVESIVKQSVFSGAIRRRTYTRVKSLRIASSVLDTIRYPDEALFAVRGNITAAMTDNGLNKVSLHLMNLSLQDIKLQ